MQIADLAKQHLSGEPVQRLAKRNGISCHALKGLLKRRGYRLRGIYETAALRRAKTNDSFFSVIDSEEKAYWLGFIAADGCVSNNRKTSVLTIALSVDDQAHLEKFRVAISSEVKISTCGFISFGKKFYKASISVRSPRMIEDLKRHGIGVRKSLREAEPSTLPDSLKRHFYRGLVDGDGWFAAVGNTRSGPQIGFCGGLKVVRSFKRWVSRIEGVGRPKIVTRDNGYSKITYCGGKQVRLITKALYLSATVSLDRKYVLSQEILKGDL